MKKTLREYAPFIILSYSLIFSIAYYFDFYFTWYKYLPDLLGYSVFTNLFMYSVYMNKKYCNATKFCVGGLILINLLNLMYEGLGVDGNMYDIALLLIISMVLILKKM